MHEERDTLWHFVMSILKYREFHYVTVLNMCGAPLQNFPYSSDLLGGEWSLEKDCCRELSLPFDIFTQHWHANSLFSPSNSPQLLPKMNCIHNPNYEKSLPFVSTNFFFLLKILNQVINGSRSRWAGARNSHTKRIFTDWSIFSISFLW